MRRMRMLKSKTTALLAATLVVGLLAVPASADDEEKLAGATANCTGTAEVEALNKDKSPQGRGITFPHHGDDLFSWELETTCTIVFADGSVQTGTLDVEGQAEGSCGASIANPYDASNEDPDNNPEHKVALATTLNPLTEWNPHGPNDGKVETGKGLEVDLKNIAWVSEGSLLEVTFDWNQVDGKGVSGTGAAEVQASPADPLNCDDPNNGETDFEVTIVSELQGVEGNGKK